ncbi:MAG TPA: hypothetical protein VEK38_01950 [Candidatus Bathyarchaeia archaeon]|nr:hypothetical protein [Candidatus Bathyarchaeia archaeon]
MVDAKKYTVYFLLTLKSFKETARALINPLFLFGSACICIGYGIMLYTSFLRTMPWVNMVQPYHAFFLFFAVLAARPSTKLKTTSYFVSYWYVLPYILFLMLLYGIFVVFFEWVMLVSCHTLYGHFVCNNVYIRFFLENIFFKCFYWKSPLIIFSLLFFVDSGQSYQFFRSVMRGVKLAIYNYPLCFSVSMLIDFVYKVVFACIVGQKIMPWKMRILFSSIWAIAILFCIVVIFTNIYVKKVHEQFDRYFFLAKK